MKHRADDDSWVDRLFSPEGIAATKELMQTCDPLRNRPVDTIAIGKAMELLWMSADKFRTKVQRAPPRLVGISVKYYPWSYRIALGCWFGELVWIIRRADGDDDER